MNEAGHYLLCLPKMPSDKKLKKKSTNYSLKGRTTFPFTIFGIRREHAMKAVELSAVETLRNQECSCRSVFKWVWVFNTCVAPHPSFYASF